MQGRTLTVDFRDRERPDAIERISGHVEAELEKGGQEMTNGAANVETKGKGDQ